MKASDYALIARSDGSQEMIQILKIYSEEDVVKILKAAMPPLQHQPERFFPSRIVIDSGWDMDA
jgi:hypothetical protein